MKLSPWLKFLPYLKPYIKQEILLILLLLSSSACALASPYVLKIIIDQVFPNKDYELLSLIIIILFGIYLLRIVFYFISDYLYTWVGNRIMLTLTTKLFDHIIQLPLSFFRERDIGDIVYRLNMEIGQIKNALTGSIINFLNNLFSIVGLIVMLCILDTNLFLTISIIYPFLFVTVRYFEPAIKRIIEKIHNEESNILGHFTERFLNVQLIKSFNAFNRENLLVKNKIENLAGLNINSVLLSSGSRNISLLLLALIPLIILGVGGNQVLQGTLTLGTLVAFLQYANRLHAPYKNLIHLYIELINTSVSMERVFNFLKQPVQFPKNKKARQCPKNIESIHFKNISFSYKKEMILESLDLNLKIGKNYAFVGSSGCGKSTLLNLLCKLYEPNSGKILINDLDLEDIAFDSWIEQVTVINQKPLLFNDSIEDNIRYGSFESSTHEVRKVAKQIQLLSELKKLKIELKESVSNQGNKLSGGQQQKVALARALLKKANILLLDEATSSIDAESESIIINRIIKEKKYKSVILVTHRLSTLRYVDEVVVFKQGKIVESGNLSELIAKQGYFFQLFQLQLEALV